MKKLVLFFCLVAHTLYAGQLPNKFVEAIHQTETSGRFGPILGDHGKALGPLQIHYACWKDSGVPGKYSDCADYSYSVRVMNAYLNRFGAVYVKRNDFKNLARMWNGGPGGLKDESTLSYWKKVKKRLDN